MLSYKYESEVQHKEHEPETHIGCAFHTTFHDQPDKIISRTNAAAGSLFLLTGSNSEWKNFNRMEWTESNEVKNILGLQLPTDPRWVDLAAVYLEDILTDHAYCEQKAATTCISLIQKHSDRTLLVQELAPIVTEEWGHFRLVLQELQKRQLKFGKQRKDEYVNQLLAFQKKGGSPEERLLDHLLTMAMIEARSCERFKRLSEGLPDDYLRQFYRRFMESEAGHYKLFIELAEHYVDKEKVRKRWAEWLEEEARIISNLTVRGDRIH